MRNTLHFTPFRPRRARWMLALLGLGLGLVGCSSTPTRASTPDDQIFVGEVATSDAFIALVVDSSGQTLAYVCDNTTVAEWFQGAASKPST
jgi:hypothetical protein